MFSRHLIIKGKVQGVFYRATAKKMADRLGITGWIRNMANGNVETIIQGDIEQLDNFTDWCRIGPQMSNVTEIIISEKEEDLRFNDFSIKD